MCGIAGIFAYRASAPGVAEKELTVIRDHMAARGPDGAGTWLDGNGRIGLAHRRLSLIDLSENGAQPMHSADGKLAITFNGEIYNYRALRAGLREQGFVFRTESDTEVLLHLYAQKGADMVRELCGMFAFAIWDSERQGLLLARDPYGIKPLYYAEGGGTLRFASQVKALLAGGAISRDPDPAGLVGFHLFGSVPEPFTTTRAIQALPAGSTLWLDAQGLAPITSYFSIAKIYTEAEAAPLNLAGEALQAHMRAGFLQSVRHHMVADVPVGVFLSAGVDSGALLGLMRDAGHEGIDAVTLAYEEFKTAREDEAPLAARVAALYGARHRVRMVTEAEFHADLPRLLEAMDQPTIDGVNSWFVSKAARELGLKAAISGLGGDELLGGYPSFRSIPRLVKFAAAPFHLGLGGIFRAFMTASGLGAALNPKAAGMVEYGGSFAGAYFLRRGLFMPWELSQVMEPGLAAEGLQRLEPVRHIAESLRPMPRSAFARVATLEASLYMRNQLLRDADWAGMAHSLEIRVPLVDAGLLRHVAPVLDRVSGGAGKALLAASPEKPLPQDIVARAKTGFGVPVSQWLERDERLQSWRRVPGLARAGCPWARRWAAQVAA